MRSDSINSSRNESPANKFFVENNIQDPLLSKTVACGRYQIKKLLGQGAFGSVYIVIDNSDPEMFDILF